MMWQSPRACRADQRARGQAEPRCTFPGFTLSTDIIVGFPGETEADFEGDARPWCAREVGFTGVFGFKYSPRRDTEAAEFVDEFVPHEVQVERMERLVEVVQRRARERAQRFVGRTLDVLVEGPSRYDPSRLRGRTTHNKVVNFDGLAVAGRDRAGRDPLGHVAVDDRHGIAALPRGLMLPWPAPPLADDVVTLRPWRRDDESAKLAAFADPTFQRFSDWEPDDLATQEQWRLRGEQIQFALVDAADAVLGGASLYRVRRRASRGRLLAGARRAGPRRRHPRGPCCSRAGRSTRSAWSRLELTCGPDNVASQRVAERCGFTPRRRSCARTCRSRAGAATPCSTACCRTTENVRL